MADIQQLVVRTRAIKAKSDRSVGWKLAAMKAVEASGVRNESDVKRISHDVYVALCRDGTILSRTTTPRRGKRAAAWRR